MNFIKQIKDYMNCDVPQSIKHGLWSMCVYAVPKISLNIPEFKPLVFIL